MNVKKLELSIMKYWPYAMLVWVMFLSWRVNNFYLGKDAFFYAKLGESIWGGMGIAMWDSPYVVLPPGFPILIGAVDQVLCDLAWSGKIVGILAFFGSIYCFRAISVEILKESKWVNFSLILFSLNSGILLNSVSGYSESCFIVVFLIMMLHFFRSSSVGWIQVLGTSVLWSLLYYIKPEGLIIGGIIYVLLVSKFRNNVFVYLIPIVTFVLIFPYLLFLKNYTSNWQISGKTYVNLVFGELEGPHQKAVEGEYPNRYYIADLVGNDPLLAKDPADYWKDPHNDLMKRVFVNWRKLGSQWSDAFSWIGIALGLLGVYFSRNNHWWIVILPIFVYLIFFILQRSLTTYYWIWIVLMTIGLKEMQARLNARWPNLRYVQWSVIVLLCVFNMRSVLKVTADFIFQ